MCTHPIGKSNAHQMNSCHLIYCNWSGLCDRCCIYSVLSLVSRLPTTPALLDAVLMLGTRAVQMVQTARWLPALQQGCKVGTCWMRVSMRAHRARVMLTGCPKPSACTPPFLPGLPREGRAGEGQEGAEPLMLRQRLTRCPTKGIKLVFAEEQRTGSL